MERYTVVKLASGKYAILCNVPDSFAFCKVNGTDRWNTHHEASDSAADLMDKYGYTV